MLSCVLISQQLARTATSKDKLEANFSPRTSSCMSKGNFLALSFDNHKSTDALPANMYIEYHNGWGWKWPLEVIWSNSPAWAAHQLPWTMYNIRESLRLETLPLLQGACSCAQWTLREKREVFPDVQREPPVLQFGLISSRPVTGHLWKEPGSILFTDSFQVLYTLMCSLRSLPFSMLSIPSSVSLS